MYLKSKDFDKILDKKIINIIIQKLFAKDSSSNYYYCSSWFGFACDLDLFRLNMLNTYK